MTSKYHKTIGKHLFVFVVSVVFASGSLFSQNLYDLNNSERYADYLLLSNQYKLAAEEYERLTFLDKQNEEYKVKLLQSYRKSGNYSQAINRAYSFNKGSLFDLSRGLSVEYLSSLIFADSLIEIKAFLQHNTTLKEEDKNIFECSSKLLLGEYRNNKKLCVSYGQSEGKIPKRLEIIANKALDNSFKSPVLAGGLSTVIPGLGKVYTKNYTDGIMSLLFIVGTAWQSYKGFKNKGNKSISGWLFGSISLGFYIGNIYGSTKAAKRYNKLKLNETNDEVYNFIQHYSF